MCLGNCFSVLLYHLVETLQKSVYNKTEYLEYPSGQLGECIAISETNILEEQNSSCGVLKGCIMMMITARGVT